MRPAGLELPVPPVVRAIAAGRSVTAVWHHEEGTTFELRPAGPGAGADIDGAATEGDGDGAGGHHFVKWAPGHSGVLPGEAARLRWAGHYARVPAVVAVGREDDCEWLVTEALAGDNAIAERWRAAPATAVRAIGEGLRALHEVLPVAACPFSWDAAERYARACQKAQEGRQLVSQWAPEHRHLSVAQALERVSAPPPVESLVVCHGDSCAPNTILDADGHWCGHVDFGAMGVADRWADLAIATWSTQWNYGPGWEGELLAAYGAGPDAERTRYYRLLWDLC